MLREVQPLASHRAEATLDRDTLLAECQRLRERVEVLEMRLRKREDQRHALLHILGDLSETNERLSNQRKAIVHILIDYERERRRLAGHTERLDSSRRALLHILQDYHQSNDHLERSRKAMIHIMSDLHETTGEVQRREQELRTKQEQLVQAGKLATLGELTTGVAHELNNPLNNIGLFVGNAIDLTELDRGDKEPILHELRGAVKQVGKATEIIKQLRRFGRAAPVNPGPVSIRQVIEGALALMREQLRLRQIELELRIDDDPIVLGSAIQLEQVFVNLLTNARDALAEAPEKLIRITCTANESQVDIRVSDTGPGVPDGLEQRIFDPFFTTKEVGQGTGLGLSITYGIIKEHHGTIVLAKQLPDTGATFLIQLPLTRERPPVSSAEDA